MTGERVCIIFPGVRAKSFDRELICGGLLAAQVLTDNEPGNLLAFTEDD